MKLLLLHGLGQNAASWDETAALLPAEWEISRPELSRFPDGNFTYEHLYEGLRGELEKQGAPSVICGLSLGAVLALNLAIDAPDLVKRLILIAPQFQMPKRLLKLQGLMFRLMPKHLFEEIGIPKKGVIALNTSMAELDFSGVLDRVKCPTLILCGERDSVNKKAAEKLGGLLKNAENAVIPNAGHEVNLENPRALAELIRKILESNTYD